MQAEEALGELRGNVDALRNRIREVGQQVTTVADRGTIDQQAADRLVALLDSTLGTEYARLREAYISMRERLRSLAETRDRVQRLLRGFPSSPTAQRRAGDRRPGSPGDGLGSATVARQPRGGHPARHHFLRQVAAGLEQLDQRLGVLLAVFDRIDTRLDEVQVALDTAEARLQMYVNIAAIALTLLFLYGALLHAALIAAGRSWWRPEAESRRRRSRSSDSQAPSASLP